MAAGRSTYHHEWSTSRFPGVVENNFLSVDPDPALSVSALFSFYPIPHFGVQAGFGYLKSPLAGLSVFDFKPPSGPVIARQDRWEATGELTAVPLCLNLAARTGPGTIQAFASAGLSVILNSVLAKSAAGLGAAAASAGGEERLDAFKIPVEVEDQTWTSIGANIGGGVAVRLGRRIALSAEIRYFLCPAKDFGWTWAPGVYNGLTGNISGFNFSKEPARLAGQRTTLMTIRPAFIQAAVGLKFFVPGIIKVSAGGKNKPSAI